MYLSPFILGEVERVLVNKFGWQGLIANEAVSDMRRWATVISPTDTITAVTTDDDDNRILECCLECRADYLVTGDRRDLLPLGSFCGTTIVNAAVFLRVIGESSNVP